MYPFPGGIDRFFDCLAEGRRERFEYSVQVGRWGRLGKIQGDVKEV